METPTLKQKYDKIMEVMSDKTLGFGCLVHKKDIRGQMDVNYVLDDRKYDGCIQTLIRVSQLVKVAVGYSKRYEVIGHPLTIGRVLQWGYDNRDATTRNEPMFEANVILRRPKQQFSQPIEPTEDFHPVIEFLYSFCEGGKN